MSAIINRESFTDKDICFVFDFINNNISFIKKYAKRLNLKTLDNDTLRIQVHCLLIEKKIIKMQKELKCK